MIVAAAVLACMISPAWAKSDHLLKVRGDIVIKDDMSVEDVVVVSGDATVYGKVAGGIFAMGGDVYLKPGCMVEGEVVTVGGAIVREPGAIVKGSITEIGMPRFIPSPATLLEGGWLNVWATLSVFVLLGFLGLAVLLLALLPKHLNAVIIRLEGSFARMLGWGFVWALLIVPIAILLAISIVGIVLIPLEVFLVALAMIIGYIAAAAFIGKRILKAVKRATHPFVEAIVGIVSLFFIGFLPVIGAVIKAVFVIAGFGAVFVTRFGTKG